MAALLLVCCPFTPAGASGIWLYEMVTPDQGTAAAGRAALAVDASTAAGRPAQQQVRHALLTEALTSYGHANVFLTPRWQMSGALESLSEMLLFGLTTAFLFAMIQRVWPLGSRQRRPPA